MKTRFASPERSSSEDLRIEIESVASNPVIDGVLKTAGGLLAVLNEHRQILAVNHALLGWLGVDGPADLLGLRPGEAVGCVHADEGPEGCGTGDTCVSCGAAIAIVTSLASDGPAHRTCALTIRRRESTVDLYLRVHCSPIRFQGRRFLLLFLQDITREQGAAVSARVFFHDLANVVSGLIASSESLARHPESHSPERLDGIVRLSRQLASEVRIQRCLTQPEAYPYQQAKTAMSVGQVIQEVRAMFADHPAARGKQLIETEPPPQVDLRTDQPLLLRVLSNMVINALEATPDGGQVKLWAREVDGAVRFSVWNAQAIGPEIVGRIFHRFFSTKDQFGRGLGTYSMKLLGEQLLGGKVRFTTSPTAGTTFTFELPR
jgi:signal transduction histidine kinase